jgi:chromosome segregation ATPase
MADNNDPQLARLAERLTRLEEAVGFAEHAGEQLSEEIRLLGGRLRDLTRRLDAMESRLGVVAERVDQVEARTGGGGDAAADAAPDAA